MNFIGLIKKFPVNRPLTTQEISDHLLPTQPTRSRPRHQLSVIRMNSTYLECVDKFFAYKGCVTAMTGFYILLFSSALVPFILMLFDIPILSTSGQLKRVLAFIGVCAIDIPLILYTTIQLKKDSFRLTHYPMRFNRKTRMVHVFRLDGTILTESWDKLYFTVWRPPNNSLDNFEIHAHRLAEDGKTVLETFGLPHEAHYDSEYKDPFFWSVWEFVRIYMEEGPEKLYNLVDHAPNIAEKRETWLRGFQQLVIGNFGSFPIVALILSPIGLFFSIGRWFAMHTSKIPHWPAEIEAECQIEPGDPYIRDAKHLAARYDY